MLIYMVAAIFLIQGICIGMAFYDWSRFKEMCASIWRRLRRKK